MGANKIGLKILLLSFLAIISVETTAVLLTSGDRHLPMATLGVVRLLETILILLIVATRGKDLSSVGLAPGTLVSGLKMGLIWSASAGLVAAVIAALLFTVGVNPIKLICMKMPAKRGDLILFFCSAGIMGPIAEEVFFRGVLYGFFRKWGVWTALILSTSIFVLAHPRLSGLPLTQVVGGILFAAAYETGGSLVSPITIHVLGNVSIFAVSLLACT